MLDIQIITLILEKFNFRNILTEVMEAILYNSECKKPDILMIFEWVVTLTGQERRHLLNPLPHDIGKLIMVPMAASQLINVPNFSRASTKLAEKGWVNAPIRQHVFNGRLLNSQEKKMLCIKNYELELHEATTYTFSSPINLNDSSHTFIQYIACLDEYLQDELDILSDDKFVAFIDKLWESFRLTEYIHCFFTMLPVIFLCIQGFFLKMDLESDNDSNVIYPEKTNTSNDIVSI